MTTREPQYEACLREPAVTLGRQSFSHPFEEYLYETVMTLGTTVNVRTFFNDELIIALYWRWCAGLPPIDWRRI